MNSQKALSSHKTNDIILNINPQRNNKPLLSKQDKKPKQALKNRFTTCSHFSFIYLGILTNYVEPQRLISHLKKLKALRNLTLDLTYFLQIPKHYIVKILTSLKYLKDLSVLHFELKRTIYLVEPSFQALCQAIPKINNMLNLQIKFTFETSRMTIDKQTRLITLLESFSKLEKFTAINLTFVRYADISPILEVTETLRASKSLTNFSLTFEKCKFDASNRLHELFPILKEVKLMRNLELIFEECEVFHFKTLKAIIPLIGEVGQNANVMLKFNNYRYLFPMYKRSFIIKSIQKIKSTHHIQVQFIEKFRMGKKLKSLYRECLASYRNMDRAKKIFIIIVILGCIGFSLLLVLTTP